MMAYRFTYSPRFLKHFKSLTAQEKNLLNRKLKLLAENPLHPSAPQAPRRPPWASAIWLFR